MRELLLWRARRRAETIVRDEGVLRILGAIWSARERLATAEQIQRRNNKISQYLCSLP
jgi:hypothetical protein